MALSEDVNIISDRDFADTLEHGVVQLYAESLFNLLPTDMTLSAELGELGEGSEWGLDIENELEASINETQELSRTADTSLIENSEVKEASSKPVGVVDAREWLEAEDEVPSADIVTIVKTYIREIKKLKSHTAQTLKILIKIVLVIFTFLHLHEVGVFIFDCSSAHEGLADDALNVNNMNIGLGWSPRHPWDCATSHPDEKLRGQAKGIKAVLQEWESLWDEFTSRCKQQGKKVIDKCSFCSKLEVKKDAERRLAAAEAMGQEDTLTEQEISAAETVISEAGDSESDDAWCCMYRILSLQEDFMSERPLI
ncbi:hypothetical protein OF83DRAFT_1175978 [Amylostereum chailletii]|nr:hypothetical protein OF83DRAFT_1175978 [Amylostereum chailletii]